MDFLVTIDQFDGPLDLLLHLIKENKLELMDLDMDVLATQYIEYIHAMQDIHLIIASEYLVELATMIEYKSRKLLPREEVVVEEEYEEDTRDQLVERLIEYQRFKEASNTLRKEYDNRQQQFTRPVASVVEDWKVPVEMNELEQQSPYELMKAMNRVLNRMKIVKPYETKITIKEISLEERLEQVKEKFKDRTDPIPFEEVYKDCATKHVVIVTFLSILDLIHQKWMTFTIDEDDNIWLYVYQHHPEFEEVAPVSQDTTYAMNMSQEDSVVVLKETVEEKTEDILDEIEIPSELEKKEEIIEEPSFEQEILVIEGEEDPSVLEEIVEESLENNETPSFEQEIIVSESEEEPSVLEEKDEVVEVQLEPSEETSFDEIEEVEEPSEMNEKSFFQRLFGTDFTIWICLGIVLSCGLLLLYLLWLKKDKEKELKEEVEKIIPIKKNSKKEIQKKLSKINDKLIEFNRKY